MLGERALHVESSEKDVTGFERECIPVQLYKCKVSCILYGSKISVSCHRYSLSFTLYRTILCDKYRTQRITSSYTKFFTSETGIRHGQTVITALSDSCFRFRECWAQNWNSCAKNPICKVRHPNNNQKASAIIQFARQMSSLKQQNKNVAIINEDPDKGS